MTNADKEIIEALRREIEVLKGERGDVQQQLAEITDGANDMLNMRGAVKLEKALAKHGLRKKK